MASREGQTLTAERIKKEQALAALRQLELAERKGQLISAEDAIREWSGACVLVREHLLALPERVAANLAGKTEAEIRQVLTMEITSALRALSKK